MLGDKNWQLRIAKIGQKLKFYLHGDQELLEK